MIIRLNDFSHEWAVVGHDVLAAVERVGDSGRYILGDQVKAFEEALVECWPAAHVAASQGKSLLPRAGGTDD